MRTRFAAQLALSCFFHPFFVVDLSHVHPHPRPSLCALAGDDHLIVGYVPRARRYTGIHHFFVYDSHSIHSDPAKDLPGLLDSLH